MRTIVITSRATFVPDNYAGFLRALFARAGKHVAALVVVDNLNRSVIKAAFGAAVFGARRLAFTMMRNIATTAFDPRIELATRAGIPVLVAPRVNDARVLAWIREKKPDLVVNARTRSLYGHELLRLPALGCINIHHGVLPECRGAMCDLHALADGRSAGFSIHIMTDKLDDGPILLTRIVSPAGSKDYLAHLAASAEVEADALARLLGDIAAAGHLPAGVPNVSSTATYVRTPRTRREIRAVLAAGVRV